MKQITVKKEVSETKYETIDGEVFNTEEQALSWEDNLRCIAKSRILSKLKQLNASKYWKLADLLSLDDCSDIFLFTPENETDIKNLLMYLDASFLGWLNFCKNMREDMKAGNKYILILDGNSGYLAAFSESSFNDYIKERVSLFDQAIKGIEEEENK